MNDNQNKPSKFEPDWSKAPDDAKYYVINGDGVASWHKYKPAFMSCDEYEDDYWMAVAGHHCTIDKVFDDFPAKYANEAIWERNID
jgi:hypothetical protein